MSNTFKGVIRQGDVLLLPMTNSQVNGKSLSHLTLAHGEVTGHSHRISTGKAKLYEKNGVLYLRVFSQEVTLKHEEHDNLKIPHGNWMVRIQREYQPVKNYINPSPRAKFYPENKVNNKPLKNKNQVNKKDFVKQKNTVIQSTNDTIIQLTNESSTIETKRNNIWEDKEMHELASQINVKYWNKKVKDAEKRKEYLDRLQAKSKQKENVSKEGEKNKKSVNKKIKYTNNNNYEYDWQKPKYNTFVARQTTSPSKSSNPLSFLNLPKPPNFKSSQVENTPKPKRRVTRRVVQNQPTPQQNWRNVVD